MDKKELEKYEVFYKDTLIGILTVDVIKNKYCYDPNYEGVEKVKDTACLIKVMIEGSNGFIEPIPFFQNRLMNMKRLGLQVGNYQTDWFVIREIME